MCECVSECECVSDRVLKRERERDYILKRKCVFVKCKRVERDNV